MRHFKNVIVRIPGKGISEGITSNPQLGKPVYENALVQHEHYVEALAKCGVQVNVLPPNNDFPDSCFMEDTALCTDKCAIISRPGAETRRNETQLEDFRKLKIYGSICRKKMQRFIRRCVIPSLVER